MVYTFERQQQQHYPEDNALGPQTVFMQISQLRQIPRHVYSTVHAAQNNCPKNVCAICTSASECVCISDTSDLQYTCMGQLYTSFTMVSY